MDIGKEALEAVAEPVFANDGKYTGDVMRFHRGNWPVDVTFDVFVPLEIDEALYKDANDKSVVWN